MQSRNVLVGALALLFFCCGDDYLPRPRAMLRLDYPGREMVQLDADCPFTFEYNDMAVLKNKGGCALDLNYPPMKGAIYITYKPVQGNLRELLTDAQKLSYEHVVKADNIIEQPFVNIEDKVYGMYYEVQGNAASQAQFYATDSTEHFLTGSLYFYARPNYDSIYPAAIYLQKDVRRILESLRWK